MKLLLSKVKAAVHVNPQILHAEFTFDMFECQMLPHVW